MEMIHRSTAIQKKVEVSIKDGKTFSEKVFSLELWSIADANQEKTIQVRNDRDISGPFKQIQFTFDKDRNYVYTKNDYNQKEFDDTYKGIASEFSISGLLEGNANTVIRTSRTNSASDVTEQYNGPAELVHVKVEQITNADLKPEPKKGFVRVWDLNTGELLNTIETQYVEGGALALTSDNSKIVSGYSDRKIRVWDLNTGKLLNTLEGHSWSVSSVAITSDNSKIVSGSDDGTIRIWDLNTGKLLNTLEVSYQVYFVAITSDNSKIVSGNLNTEMYIESEANPPPITPKIVTRLGQSSTHLVADKWTKEDALGYHIYAHALAKFITHDKTDGPLCVSIQAPWGQGKTSLMRMVQSELDKDAASQEPTESLNKQVQRVIDQQNVKLREIMDGTNITSAGSGSKKAVQKRIYNPFKAFYKKLPFFKSSTPNSKTSSLVEQDNLDLGEIVKREIVDPQPFSSLEVRSNIEEEVNPRLTIWFNAWAYESSEKVWSGLADSIVQQIAERLNKEERTSFLLGLHVRRHGTAKILKLINARISSKWWQNVRPKMKKYVPFIGISLIVATLGWVNENQFWPIAGVSGLVGSVIAGSLQIFRERAQAQLSVEDEPAQESLGEYVEVPDYSKASTFMTDVVEDIQTILKRIPKGYLPMVIFIDDLDRCSPTKVTDIIEALNLFLGGGYFSNCMFMIGMDAEMVAAALEESYSKVIDRLPKYPSYAATGWRFMDKFVQLPFVIPQAEPTDIERYVKNLFLQDEVKGKEGKQKRGTVDKINEAAREAINEIEPPKHDSEIKEKQIMKTTQVEQLTKSLAEKHGLTNDKDQEVLKSEIGKHADVKELNTTINSFSYEDPEIRGLILDAAPGFLGNPREVKRFMNVFRFHFFLLSARQTKGLGIPSLKQLSHWIVLTLRWPTLARWIQANNQRLAQLEEFGQKCKDKSAWRTRVQEWLQPDPDAIPEIFDDELYFFFRDEGTKKRKDRLSSAYKQGLF
jgi:hypothetical protein